jgi:hypothetical protein
MTMTFELSVVGAARTVFQSYATRLRNNALTHYLKMQAAFNLTMIAIANRFKIRFTDARTQSAFVGILRHTEERIKVKPFCVV